MRKSWIEVTAGCGLAVALTAPIGAAPTAAVRLRPTATAAAPPSAYTIVELGTLPGFSSNVPVAINDRGVIVSNFCCTGAPSPLGGVAGISASGRFVRFGPLAGFAANSVSALNGSGLAVGSAIAPASSGGGFWQHTHAVAFTGQGTKDLGVLPGYTDSEAAGVNEAGDAIGDSQSVTKPINVTYFHNGRTISLGVGYGVAINNHGVALGGLDRATLYTRNGARVLGTLAPAPRIPASSTGTALNDRDVAVGSSSYQIPVYPWYFQHAFIADATGMHDLGVPAGDDFLGTASTAYGINNLNEVVGYYLPGTSGNTISLAGPPTAFIYSDGKIRDLNSLLPAGSGWMLENALSINNCGDIVGIGTHNGVTRGYALYRRQIDLPQLRSQWGCRR